MSLRLLEMLCWTPSQLPKRVKEWRHSLNLKRKQQKRIKIWNKLDYLSKKFKRKNLVLNPSRLLSRTWKSIIQKHPVNLLRSTQATIMRLWRCHRRKNSSSNIMISWCLTKSTNLCPAVMFMKRLLWPWLKKKTIQKRVIYSQRSLLKKLLHSLQRTNWDFLPLRKNVKIVKKKENYRLQGV